MTAITTAQADEGQRQGFILIAGSISPGYFFIVRIVPVTHGAYIVANKKKAIKQKYFLW